LPPGSTLFPYTTLFRSEAHQRFGGLSGLRFNIGRVEGGIKANMIAPSAEVRFGFRPLPSMSIDALHGRLRGLAPDTALDHYEERSEEHTSELQSRENLV